LLFHPESIAAALEEGKLIEVICEEEDTVRK
jgi:hypothetical protein